MPPKAEQIGQQGTDQPLHQGMERHRATLLFLDRGGEPGQRLPGRKLQGDEQGSHGCPAQAT